MTVSSMSLPYLADNFLIREGVSFLNHGSFGATPQPVFERYQSWQRELESQPVEFLGRRVRDLLAAARRELAAYLGVSADDLVYVRNATMGVNVVARSLNLGPGDEVLTTDHEYGAAVRTWRYLSQERGFTLAEQPLPVPVSDPQVLVEALFSGVNNSTRVIFLSHITSPTALILPVSEICRRARENGILTLVDGAHAPGQIDLNLKEIGADFYTGNLHKWVCAPKGAAFLHAQPEVQDLLQPLIVSWGWEPDGRGPSAFIDQFERIGTDDPSAYLAAPAAIDFQRCHNWHAVRDACHALAVEFHNEMSRRTGLPPLSPPSRRWFEQMVSLPLPALKSEPGGRPSQGAVDVQVLKAALWEEHQIEIPVFEWNGRNLIRISLQAYNGPKDVERLLSALSDLQVLR